MIESRRIKRAAFDPKLRFYWFWNGALMLFMTIIGIPLLPIWFLGVGQLITRKRYDALECELTDRALHFKRGILFKLEKTIPLDKIQDLSLRTGPILNWLGLAELRLETAGQGSPQGMADASLVGVIDAVSFRNLVLRQRDEVVESRVNVASTVASSGQDTAVLQEILVTLKSIEGQIGDAMTTISSGKAESSR